MRFLKEMARDDLIAAAVLVRNVEIKPSGPALLAALDALYRALKRGEGPAEATRLAVRRVLRNGRYRPSGRGKPAQEYLLRVFEEKGCLDLINNAADVNNLVSLRTGLPISAFDADKLVGDLVLRLGRVGESYVFNATEQVLDCRDLVVVCDGRGPIGSPVKDSQETKVFPGATSVLYVIYGSSEATAPEDLSERAQELGRLLCAENDGAEVSRPVAFTAADSTG